MSSRRRRRDLWWTSLNAARSMTSLERANHLVSGKASLRFRVAERYLRNNEGLKTW